VDFAITSYKLSSSRRIRSVVHEEFPVSIPRHWKEGVSYAIHWQHRLFEVYSQCRLQHIQRITTKLHQSWSTGSDSIRCQSVNLKIVHSYYGFLEYNPGYRCHSFRWCQINSLFVCISTLKTKLREYIPQAFSWSRKERG
jgi:hypothetical protein